MRHENTDFRGALSFLDMMYSKNHFKAPRAIKATNSLQHKPNEETLILDAVLPLKSKILENYLRDRGIDISIAQKYLEVVQFHHKEKGTKYFGLGLKNESGDYEIRNAKLKTVVGNKDITFIKGRGEDSTAVAVFEGMTDFLSYLSEKKEPHLKNDVIILNSVKLVERAKKYITKKDYQKVYTFFDNDTAGEKAQKSFSELKNDIKPCNYIYRNFKDYNEFWQNELIKQFNR